MIECAKRQVAISGQQSLQFERRSSLVLRALIIDHDARHGSSSRHEFGSQHQDLLRQLLGAAAP